MDKSQIRDAATVILIRDRSDKPKVLMGQRGSKAVFMPGKFVFPGGAVDDGDRNVLSASRLPTACMERLEFRSDTDTAQGLCAAAIRELWEETGLLLGKPGAWQAPNQDWEAFSMRNLIPDASALSFVFRAVTPRGRPRRFDARFFLADADAISGDPDDFSSATDELSHLQWISLEETRQFDLPFITQVVLSEIANNRDLVAPSEGVPFFNYEGETAEVLRIRP